MSTPTEIHVSQILPGTAYELIGTNSTATKDVYLTLSGTTNQVGVSTAGTTITLSTPQNIDSTASPTFAGLTVTKAGSLTLLFNATGVALSKIQLEGNGNSNSIITSSDGQFTLQGNDIVNFLNYQPSGSVLTLTATTTTFTNGLTATGTITATNQTLAIKNIDITSVASDPGSPVEGQLWYNSTNHQLILFNGTSNVIVA